MIVDHTERLKPVFNQMLQLSKEALMAWTVLGQLEGRQEAQPAKHQCRVAPLRTRPWETGLGLDVEECLREAPQPWLLTLRNAP